MQTASKHYIGRFTFSYRNELLIFDWRSPIAGMFYDCEVGPAGYDAPMGRIKGSLTRKRQFKITNGVMEYALESSVNIQDNVLLRELSHTSDEKMKSIISTIQREQNQIIRSEKAETLIIQGVAGSGKTSIALHRIAFLLYRFKENLSAGNVMILSPNKVFGNYISTVLPELGEEPVCELSFADIADVQLGDTVGFEPDKDSLEFGDAKWAERVQFKSTLDFVKKMDTFLQEVPASIFVSEDYIFGHVTVAAEFIQARFHGYQTCPIKKRLPLVAADIHDRFGIDSFREDEIPSQGSILKNLNKMLKVKSSLALYKEFYKWLGRPELFILPARNILEWSDVYPFLYLKEKFEGLQESRLIKHLVIDEMQDYTPIQYAVLNRLFSCSKTILGDFGQFINPNHLNTLTDLQKQYSGASLVELTKSYRSTYEIITYARKIQQEENLEPVERHGDLPVLISCRNEAEILLEVEKKLKAFGRSGDASFGIILKSDTEARTLYQKLSAEHEIHLITPDSTSFTNGISITSIRMSKGLEFDEVLVLDVNRDNYKTKYDRCLLYIAVTRAMHRLSLMHTGKPSGFLPECI